MVPTISSITPSSGHTGGQTLVEILGQNFALPPPPAPTGPTTPPAPSVQVLFGGVPAPTVWVVSTTILRCLTPIHDPSGTPARAPRPETSDPGTPAIPASDVTVQNLDAHGAAIVGESATSSAAYSFLLPRLDQPGVTTRVLHAFLAELARQVHPNINWSPNTDYDPDTGDGMNIAQLASLPGIAIVDLKLPKSSRMQNEQTEVSDGGTGFVALRPPVIRDATVTLVGVSDNKDEILNLEEIVETFFKKNSYVTIARDPDDATQGTVRFQMHRAEDVIFGSTLDGSNLQFFSCSCTIFGIPRQFMPGVQTTSIPSAPKLGAAEAIIEVGQTAKAFHVGKDRK